MTTQQPEALRLANILRGIDTRSLFANEKLSAASAALENQHARITDLESQLAQRFDAADVATAAAQGFRDGVASVSAGSEPVATVFTMEALAPGGGVKYHATIHKPLPAGTELYTRHSPPEGMAGWMPIETATKNGTEILGYTEEVGALVLYWDSMTGEMDHWSDGMSVSFWKPTHWMPLPAAPGPADGESNGN